MNKDSVWIHQYCKLEIVKDNKKLTFTAYILDEDDFLITFRDKYNVVYTFNKEFVKSINPCGEF